MIKIESFSFNLNLLICFSLYLYSWIIYLVLNNSINIVFDFIFPLIIGSKTSREWFWWLMYRFWCNVVIILMWLIDVADSWLLVWIGRVAGLSLYYGGVGGDVVDIAVVCLIVVVVWGWCWGRDGGVMVIVIIIVGS